MSSTSRVRARCGFAALGFMTFLAATGAALAGTVTLTPQKAVYARDGGLNADPVVDGQFDAVYTGETVYVWRQILNGVQREYRTGFDFQLPPEVMQAGVTIVSATLHVETSTETVETADVVTVHGIPGSSAPFVPNDFEITNAVASASLQPGTWWYPTHDFNVASRIQSLVGNGNNHASFAFGVGQWGTLLNWKPNATLTIEYTPASGNPPTLSILAPASGLTVLQGDPVAFEASATDVEDGNLDAVIQWTSNLNGSFGTGGSVSTSTLAVGAHQIVATVYDTAGNSASWLVNITVQAPVNTAPTVSIAAPLNGASLTAGVSFTLSGTANDAQQGNMGSSLQWILDGVTPLASGANASAVISTLGAHTITARVTDSGGLTSEQSVSVNVVSAPPPPANYCSLRGNVSTYEWIGGVRSGTVSNTSRGNGGYADFTSVQFNMVSGAATNLVLTPGFSGTAYTERWYVWVDLNRDRTFSANELLLSAMTPNTLTTTMTIPAGTAAGPTRMRVVMSYGTTPPSCGTFSYGEVEDYTVNVQSQGNPPPSGPTYCTSRGTSAAYEFIQQIVVNGTTRLTSNNSGYADYTSGAAIPLVRGANALALTPGFSSGSYNEQWMVWIDFNKDGIFGNEDWVFGGGGTATVNGSATVPATAPSGITRMRIQMKYGSAATPCETFNDGEVEDYAVQIP